jgi:hypothetical protein
MTETNRRTLKRARTLRNGGVETTTMVQPIYWWSHVSDNERRGVRAKYIVMLHSDGKLTCDCPGWVFHATRTCKHVKERDEQAKGLFVRYRRGGSLPPVRNPQGELIAGPTNFSDHDTATPTAAPPREVASPSERKRRVAKTKTPRKTESTEETDVTFNRKLEL